MSRVGVVTMKWSVHLASLVVILAVLSLGCAGLTIEDLIPPSEAQAPLDRDTVVAGLREALRVGAGRAIDRTSAIDGFLGNELIRILMPEELESMARGLRRIGLGGRVDELEVAMNRAAEKAAGEVRETLWREIQSLSFADAMAILRGGPTAATDHFRAQTESELRERFHPIVVARMEEVGLSRLYAELAGHYNRLPLVKRAAIDLDEYVTDRALTGVFTVLGEEEARIRADPLARTTELLRRVFRG